jgi:threonine dehydrogenase-like Zn-dependent dehydrogenase
MPKAHGCVKEGPGAVAYTEYDVPDPGPGQALVASSLTTICGSDIHVVDEIPEVPPGLPMGHEVIGTIEALGDGVDRFSVGDRIAVSCLLGCGTCAACHRDEQSVCQTLAAPMNVLFGGQADLVLVNFVDANAAVIPPSIDDKRALLATDILSTGFGAAERGGITGGETVAVFAQGPVGLCATLGASHYGAERIIVVDSIPDRIEVARRFGATDAVDPANAVDEIMAMTGGAGVDVAIEALGLQVTFENCCRVTRFGGVVSSVGVYANVGNALSMPVDGSFMHRTLTTTLCPSGTARLEHLFGLFDAGLDPTPLFTHDLDLTEVAAGYDRFRAHADGILKFAITA